MTHSNKLVAILQKYSIPLLLGVVVALLLVNVWPEAYHRLVHTPVHHLVGELFGMHFDNSNDLNSWNHYFSLHFLSNNVLMVFFFGLAALEIKEATVEGGALNPVSKAINPLFAAMGGVLGPVVAYFTLNYFMGSSDWLNGWGIPTSTDIALVWLVARVIFGSGHPAITFLLLLAIVDDAIGLFIIAIAYPNPNMSTEWINASWILLAMVLSYVYRLMWVRDWKIYVFTAGAISWYGLYSAHLHPALALVFVIPFLRHSKDQDWKPHERYNPLKHGKAMSVLERFDTSVRVWTDLGLFFFAFSNAGVKFSEISNLTWIIFLALLLGKTIGIVGFSYGADKIGFKLPQGMSFRHLFIAAIIAGIGVTVALFVSGQAFINMEYQSAAKIGALLSAFIAIPALIFGKLLRIEKVDIEEGELLNSHDQKEILSKNNFLS